MTIDDGYDENNNDGADRRTDTKWTDTNDDAMKSPLLYI